MERVYKSLVGYKPANEKNRATHIILSIEEFNAFEDAYERESLLLKTEIRQKAREYTTQLEKFKEDTNKQILDIQKKAAQTVNSYKEELEKANREINRLNDLNKNLLRIQTERANARRGLTPKKKHHGYRVLDSQQYNYIYRYTLDRRMRTETMKCWKVRIQSPYDGSIPYDTIVPNIYKDLINIFGASLGLNTVTDIENRSYDDFMELWNSDKNFIFKTSYKANIRSGLWEVEYLIKSSITVPEHMRVRVPKKEDLSS